MIDIKAMENAVIDTLKPYLSTDLSESKGVGATTVPSIFPARVFSSNGKNPPIPSYPYCLVEYIRAVEDGSSATDITDRFFDDEGNYVYLSHMKVIIQIKFYGTSGTSSDSVANKTRKLLSIDPVRQSIFDLYKQTANTGTTVPPVARVGSKSDIIPANFSMKDKYLETNQFNLTISTLDTIDIKATQAEYFDKIEMDTTNPVADVQGGFYYEDSDTPVQDLHVNVIATGE